MYDVEVVRLICNVGVMCFSYVVVVGLVTHNIRMHTT